MMNDGRPGKQDGVPLHQAAQPERGIAPVRQDASPIQVRKLVRGLAIITVNEAGGEEAKPVSAELAKSPPYNLLRGKPKGDYVIHANKVFVLADDSLRAPQGLKSFSTMDMDRSDVGLHPLSPAVGVNEVSDRLKKIKIMVDPKLFVGGRLPFLFKKMLENILQVIDKILVERYEKAPVEVKQRRAVEGEGKQREEDAEGDNSEGEEDDIDLIREGSMPAGSFRMDPRRAGLGLADPDLVVDVRPEQKAQSPHSQLIDKAGVDLPVAYMIRFSDAVESLPIETLAHYEKVEEELKAIKRTASNPIAVPFAVAGCVAAAAWATSLTIPYLSTGVVAIFVMLVIQAASSVRKNYPLILEFNLPQAWEELKAIRWQFTGEESRGQKCIIRLKSIGRIIIAVFSLIFSFSNGFRSSTTFASNFAVQYSLLTIAVGAAFPQRYLGTLIRFPQKIQNFPQDWRETPYLARFLGIFAVLGSIVTLLTFYTVSTAGGIQEVSGGKWELCGGSMEENPECNGIDDLTFYLLAIPALVNVTYFIFRAFSAHRIIMAINANFKCINTAFELLEVQNLKVNKNLTCWQKTNPVLQKTGTVIDHIFLPVPTLVGIGMGIYKMMFYDNAVGLKFWGLNALGDPGLVFFFLCGVWSMYLVNEIPHADADIEKASKVLVRLQRQLQLHKHTARPPSVARGLNLLINGVDGEAKRAAVGQHIINGAPVLGYQQADRGAENGDGHNAGEVRIVIGERKDRERENGLEDEDLGRRRPAVAAADMREPLIRQEEGGSSWWDCLRRSRNAANGGAARREDGGAAIPPQQQRPWW